MRSVDAVGVAQEMLNACVEDGQAARRLDPGADLVAVAEGLRRALRDAARDRNVRVRTALLDDVVVVARLDADLWTDDAATMRAKLTPPAS